MALTLAPYPHWRTIPEVAREIDGKDLSVEQAVVDLVCIGLRATRSGRYALSMAKQSKKPADLNRLAAAIVKDATEEGQPPTPESPEVRAGRAGGRKGGKARAAKLSSEERSAAAKKAASARWSRSR